MKSSLALLLFSSVALAQPEIILAPVDHLYIPEGFDSNDSVEVVITGTFPNAHRNQLTEKNCPQMVVPFKEVVSLGNLQGGEYEIRVNDGARKSLKDNLMVHEAASHSVDDNVYAALEYVEKKSQNDFVLHGWKYSNCMELNEVKVVSNNKYTLSILPIMKKVSDHCPMKGMPVSYPVKLDFSSLKMNQPLLHVRTMDGRSVNSVVNLEE